MMNEQINGSIDIQVNIVKIRFLKKYQDNASEFLDNFKELSRAQRCI